MSITYRELATMLGTAFQDKELDVNELGEIIRSCVFEKNGYGCYSTFDTVEGFEDQDPSNIPLEIRTLLAGCFAMNTNEIKRMTWRRSEKLNLDVFWFWDGDGTLVFRLPPYGYIIYNNDCKKDYTWSDDIKWVQGVSPDDTYYRECE